MGHQCLTSLTLPDYSWWDISVWHHWHSLTTADGTSVSDIIDTPWLQLTGHHCLTSSTLRDRTSVSDIIDIPVYSWQDISVWHHQHSLTTAHSIKPGLTGHQCLTSSTLPDYSSQHQTRADRTSVSDIIDTPCLQLIGHQCLTSLTLPAYNLHRTSVPDIIDTPCLQLTGHWCLTSSTLPDNSWQTSVSDIINAPWLQLTASNLGWQTSVSDIIKTPCLWLTGHQCLTSLTLPVYSWHHPQTDLILSDVKGRSQADEFRPQAILQRGLAAGKEGLRCLPLNVRVDGVRFAKLLKAETAHQRNQCQTAQSWNSTST